MVMLWIALKSVHLGNFVTSSLETCQSLVLNADYRPLSYFPLSLWPWQSSIKAVFMDRVDIVSVYQREVRSPTISLQLPSVVALKNYITPAQHPAFTRFNVFLRDHFSCQYCGSANELTFDHLIPRSRGGRTTWGNVVTACSPCNLAKGGSLEDECRMHPRLRPRRPTVNDLQKNGRAFPPNHLHESWRDFLYWDSELEP